MNFLADESCAGPIIRALRQGGHDVVAIAEVAKGATDGGTLARWCMRVVCRQPA